MLKSISFATPFAVLCFVVSVGRVRADDPNALTEDEKRTGFELLFDGRSLDGWDAGAEAQWKIDDEAIYIIDAGSDSIFDDGITYRAKKLPEDFELRFEWRETKPAVV